MDSLPPFLFSFLVCLLALFLTEITSNAATATILLPAIRDMVNSFGNSTRFAFDRFSDFVCCVFCQHFHLKNSFLAIIMIKYLHTSCQVIFIIHILRNFYGNFQSTSWLNLRWNTPVTFSSGVNEYSLIRVNFSSRLQPLKASVLCCIHTNLTVLDKLILMIFLCSPTVTDVR